MPTDLSVRNVDRNTEDLNLINALYDRSFPDDERIPFARLLSSLSSERIMQAYDRDSRMVGISVIFLHEDIVYLAYLATDEAIRSQGIGTAILESIRERYTDRRIVIDIEELDESADNNEERISRRNFYLRNGYQATGAFYFFYNVHYELLSTNGRVSGDDYRSLILHHWGKIAETAVFTEKKI